MSQENVELLRNGIDAWNQRQLDRWLSYAAPDVEWMPAGPAAVEQAIYRGHAEVRAGVTAAWETWEVFELHETEARDLGDSTLWLGRVKMRGGASGVELDQEFAIHSTASDGQMTAVHTYLSWREALKAVGLEE